MRGKWALIGAYGDDDLGPYAGAAYWYRWEAGELRLHGKELADDGSSYDFYGWTVALGDRRRASRRLEGRHGDPRAEAGAVRAAFSSFLIGQGGRGGRQVLGQAASRRRG